MPKHTFDAAPDTSRQFARTLYEAHAGNSGNKTTWAALPSADKDHWIAVAETAVRNPAVAESTELAKQNAQRERERAANTATAPKTAHQVADEQGATNPTATATSAGSTTRNG